MRAAAIGVFCLFYLLAFALVGSSVGEIGKRFGPWGVACSLLALAVMAFVAFAVIDWDVNRKEES